MEVALPRPRGSLRRAPPMRAHIVVHAHKETEEDSRASWSDSPRAVRQRLHLATAAHLG